MNRYEYAKEVIERCDKSDFKDHLAVHDVVHNRGEEIELLSWRARDGCSHYFTHYILHRGVLMVYGDCGEATYRWYTSPTDPTTLEIISGYDLHYFASKMCGLGGGGKRYAWDPGVATAYVEDYLERHDEEVIDEALADAESEEEQEAAQLKKDEQVRQELEGWENYIHSEQEWHHFLLEVERDYREDLGGAGEVLDHNLIRHHQGLVLAMKQLKSNADSTERQTVPV